MHDPTQNNSCKLQRGSANWFHPETQISEVEMTRIAALFAATALFAAPAVAGSYSAKPLSVPASAKIIGKDISWTCGANGCQGATETGRPLVICQDLAKRAGRLESFTVDGRALGRSEEPACRG